MTEVLKKSIEALRAVSPQLNKATDQAAALVQAVEKFLGEECSIGLSARVVVSRTEDVEVEDHEGEKIKRPFSRYLELGYERCGARFRIAVVSSAEYDDGNSGLVPEAETITPWSEAPRDVKLAAFVKLPALLEQIAKEATKAVEAAKESSETIGNIIEAMGKKQK